MMSAGRTFLALILMTLVMGFGASFSDAATHEGFANSQSELSMVADSHSDDESPCLADGHGSCGTHAGHCHGAHFLMIPSNQASIASLNAESSFQLTDASLHSAPDLAGTKRPPRF